MSDRVRDAWLSRAEDGMIDERREGVSDGQIPREEVADRREAVQTLEDEVGRSVVEGRARFFPPISTSPKRGMLRYSTLRRDHLIDHSSASGSVTPS